MKKYLLVALLVCAGASGIVSARGLPFIQDQYGKARSEALERKLPIFVECWAPW